MRFLSRLLARRRFQSQRGTSLVEMTITVAFLGLILAVVLTAVSAFERDATGAQRRLENLDEARILMAVVTKDMRTAARIGVASSPFTLAADREAIFYANVNSSYGPNKVHIYIDVKQQLIEEVTPPDPGSAPNYTYNTQPAAVRLVGRYVANPPSKPIFVYYDVSGNPLGPTPLGAANLLAIESVGVTLSIRKTTLLPVIATTLVNRVSLPNLDFNPLPSPSP